ncbi:MAG: DUF2232 domain-containing protein [Clostridia bacterium]|nr:DUF2232 domain-containing protein [Clostridia bacterium]
MQREKRTYRELIKISVGRVILQQEPEANKTETADAAEPKPAAQDIIPTAAEQAGERPLPSRLRDSGGKRLLPPPPNDPRRFMGLVRDGIVALSCSFSLLLISAYVPLLGMIALLLMPLPWAALVLRRGLAAAAYCALIFLIAVLLALDLSVALRMLLQYVLPGLMFGLILRRRDRALLALGLTLMIAAAGALGSLALQPADSAATITLSEQIETAVNDSFALLEEQGMAKRMLPGNISLEQMRQQAVGLMQQLLPAIMVIGALLTSFISCLLMLPLLRRLGCTNARLPHFSAWQLDWRLTWALILGLLCYVLSKYFALAWLYTVGLNILYVIVPIFLVCGLSFVIWLLRLEGFSLLLKLALAFVLIFFAYIGVVLLLVLVGLDSMLDLRSKLLAARDRSRGS